MLFRYRCRGVDHGGWGSWLLTTPLKICRRGQSMFWLRKMSRSFIQNCCWTMFDNSASFTSWRIKHLCQQWKVKVIFRDAWNSLMAWPDWPRPPYFTTDLRHYIVVHLCFRANAIKVVCLTTLRIMIAIALYSCFFFSSGGRGIVKKMKIGVQNTGELRRCGLDGLSFRYRFGERYKTNKPRYARLQTAT